MLYTIEVLPSHLFHAVPLLDLNQGCTVSCIRILYCTSTVVLCHYALFKGIMTFCSYQAHVQLQKFNHREGCEIWGDALACRLHFQCACKTEKTILLKVQRHVNSFWKGTRREKTCLKVSKLVTYLVSQNCAFDKFNSIKSCEKFSVDLTSQYLLKVHKQSVLLFAKESIYLPAEQALVDVLDLVS